MGSCFQSLLLEHKRTDGSGVGVGVLFQMWFVFRAQIFFQLISNPGSKFYFEDYRQQQASNNHERPDRGHSRQHRCTKGKEEGPFQPVLGTERFHMGERRKDRTLARPSGRQTALQDHA